MEPPPPLPVYVLIGGGSRRFASDKATYDLDGRPWAADTARRLATGDAPAVFVGKAPRPALSGHGRFVADAEGIDGPLAGVIAALEDRLATHGSGLLVLGSCDLVQPEPSWLAPLLERHAQQELDAAAYKTGDTWQPFPSVAHTRWLEQLKKLAALGARSMQRALEASKVTAVPWTDPPEGPPQANTPEELAELLGE